MPKACFLSLVQDLARFGLTRYFSRKAQIADIPYTPDMVTTGFPIPRDFAHAFYAENPLKPGEGRKIKLKVKGKRYDAQLERPGPAREYRIVYGQESETAQALKGSLGANLKPGDAAFTLKPSGKNEVVMDWPRKEPGSREA